MLTILMAFACTGEGLNLQVQLGDDPVTPASETAPAPPPAEGAKALVERYLRLGSAGDLEAIPALLEDGCAKQSLLNVASTHVLGARIEIDTLEVEVKEETDAAATVAFALSGKASGSGKVDTKAGGIQLKVEVGDLEADTEMKGTYTLTKTDAGWRIDCS